ncbi:hypothetical protein DV736_g1656, partial [Chaetothyriales sp. CBS 134916]
MAYYPGQGGYGAQAHGGYPTQGFTPQRQSYSPQPYPPQQQPQQQYGGYPPQGYAQQPPPPQYGYNNAPPPQGGYGGYSQPPPNNGYPGPNMQPANNYGNRTGPAPPPTAPQQFGHGAPSGYSFQYSNCTGRRKALLIGINYFNQRGQLRGCINDVKNMSTYLNQNFGYAREDMVLLTDDQQNPMSQPTKANILRAMHWLVKDARANDSLFFHYSGHDDEMHRIMVKSLAPGVRLTAIFDSCHSGSALDLPYVYSTQGVLKEPNLAKEAGQGLLSIVSSYARGDLGGMASTAMGLFKKAATGNSVYERNKETKTSPADVIMWSGSKDEQTSQDANIAGQATGAMSWAFVAALKKNPHQSYVQLLNSIRDELASKYTQKPQLSCSHPLNVDLLYVM